MAALYFTAEKHKHIVKVPLISELLKAGDVTEEEFQRIHKDMKHLAQAATAASEAVKAPPPQSVTPLPPRPADAAVSDAAAAEKETSASLEHHDKLLPALLPAAAGDAMGLVVVCVCVCVCVCV